MAIQAARRFLLFSGSPRRDSAPGSGGPSRSRRKGFFNAMRASESAAATQRATLSICRISALTRVASCVI